MKLQISPNLRRFQSLVPRIQVLHPEPLLQTLTGLEVRNPVKRQASQAMASIRSPCTTGHNTPHTEMQKPFVNNLRHPGSLQMKSTGQKIAPSQAYVDASSIGIGFTMDNRWEAWTLVTGWSKDGRDINWAEAIAVELGLRLLVQAGHRDKRVVIRSDNEGVIHAFNHGRFKSPCKNEVLMRIKNLCQMHSIDLHLGWVSTDDNLADRPSRRRHGPMRKRFLSSFCIPDHLAEFVETFVA